MAPRSVRAVLVGERSQAAGKDFTAVSFCETGKYAEMWLIAFPSASIAEAKFRKMITITILYGRVLS
jgi:hypothetical protein